MDEFDRLLESKLRRLLDPIVAKPPPARRGAEITASRISPGAGRGTRLAADDK
jgi:hypothetical protein